MARATTGDKGGVNFVNNFTQTEVSGFVGGIGTTACSKDCAENCCWNWCQRSNKDHGGNCYRGCHHYSIKNPCRVLLPGDAPKLLLAARIDSKIGARIGSRSGHQLM